MCAFLENFFAIIMKFAVHDNVTRCLSKSVARACRINCVRNSASVKKVSQIDFFNTNLSD